MNFSLFKFFCFAASLTSFLAHSPVAQANDAFVEKAYQSLLSRCEATDHECRHIALLNTASPDVLTSLANEGDARAATFLGTAYLVGGYLGNPDGFYYELEPSTDRFLAYSKLAVVNGSTDALYRLVVYYWFGLDYFKIFDKNNIMDSANWSPDFRAACDAIEVASDDQVIGAGAIPLYVGGQCYVQSGNANKGLSYLSVAATNFGHGPSASLLAEIYSAGRYGVPNSAEQAQKWLSVYAEILRSKN